MTQHVTLILLHCYAIKSYTQIYPLVYNIRKEQEFDIHIFTFPNLSTLQYSTENVNYLSHNFIQHPRTKICELVSEISRSGRIRVLHFNPITDSMLINRVSFHYPLHTAIQNKIRGGKERVEMVSIDTLRYLPPSFPLSLPDPAVLSL